MQKQKMLNHMINYLKSHNISFQQDFDNGGIRLTMIFNGCENCPDRILESCIWFYSNDLEARTYYTKTASNLCKQSENLDSLMRLFNYINSKIWTCASDGLEGLLYKSVPLHTSRLYMTEDNYYDITLTTIVNYDFYELAPLETEDYLTAACPDLLNKLSLAIFGVLLGESIDLKTAIQYINNIEI